MAYSKGYFELQLNFAKSVSQITNKKLSEVLLEYTSFYKTFRIEGWDFSPDNPIWSSFVRKLNSSKDSLSTIYQFYLEQIELKGEKNKKKLFGCFSYEYNSKKKAVSIHFRNVDVPEPGALSKEGERIRRGELREMFLDIRKKHPEVKMVTGFSWLYSINAYKRLFPLEYMKNHKVVTNWFKSTALWGQFLDSSGELKGDLVSEFERCVSKEKTLEEIKKCFPLELIDTYADIRYFYQFYGIEERS